MKKYKFKYFKNHFFFGKPRDRAGKIYIKRSYTNVFITFSDLKNKVVRCFTSGSSDDVTSKRRKRIAQAVEKIMIYVNRILKYYNPRNILVPIYICSAFLSIFN